MIRVKASVSYFILTDCDLQEIRLREGTEVRVGGGRSLKMKAWRLGWILAALLVVASSTGTILAQDQYQDQEQNAQLPANESVQNNATEYNTSGPYDNNTSGPVSY